MGRSALRPANLRCKYGAPPPMPPGWLAQWDQNSQRWYYVDQSTGRTQWDPPAGAPPPQGPYAPPAHDAHGASSGYYQGAPAGYGAHGVPQGGHGGHDERALFGNTQGYDQGHGAGGSHGYDSHGEVKKEKKDKEKDKGHSTAKLAAVGLGGAGTSLGESARTVLPNIMQKSCRSVVPASSRS